MSPPSPPPSLPRPPCPPLAVALALAACEYDGGGLATGGADDVETSAALTPDPDAADAPAACADDGWEPNDDADLASRVDWESSDAWTAWRALDELHLCPGDEDWYRLDVEGLGYSVHAVYIRALVAGAGLCGADCDQPVIPAGPEHAMTLEVHRADASELLMTQTADDGVLALDGWGDDYRRGLLIRVYSPTPSASYPYRLTVNIRNYEGEDECEC